MVRYFHKVIPIQILDPTFPYACRYRLDDAALEKSIAQKGILQPPVIASGTPAPVISGHKRVFAAKKLGLKEIEVLQLKISLTHDDAFILAALSNWKQNVSELDLAWTIAQAERAFRFSKEKILEEIYPPLDKSQDHGFYEEALEVMKLHKTLLDLIADDLLPFRGAKILTRLSKEDQEIFADKIASKAALTTNQLLKSGEWLHDLLKSSSQSLDRYLKTNSSLDPSLFNGDGRAKGERFFTALRNLRFPHLVEKEKAFTGLSQQIQGDKSGLSVEAPPFFEAEGFTLRAKIKDAKDLERLSAHLESKRKVLNSLLDIVL